ncbi:MAG: hypothetical protein R2726_05210 [Acidimicrobiales bacterium]
MTGPGGEPAHPLTTADAIIVIAQDQGSSTVVVVEAPTIPGTVYLGAVDPGNVLGGVLAEACTADGFGRRRSEGDGTHG